PAADAPINNGNITLGYYDDDLPQSIAQGTTTTTFTLDADSRRSVQTTTDPSGTSTTTRRYTDGSDNPAWSDTTTSAGTTTARYAESIGGDLSVTIDDTTGATSRGDASLSLANTHGDVVTTVTVPATDASTTPATTVTGWATYDEYGNTTAADPVDGPLGYGWLGAKQRSTTTSTAGLTLMGVRLYMSQRGLFTSIDPVAGGNDFSLGYPADPINRSDISGRFWGSKRLASWWSAGKRRAKAAYRWASQYDYGTAAAGVVNTGWAAFKIYKGIRLAKATPWCAAYGGPWGGAACGGAAVYQLGTGGLKAYRGFRQLHAFYKKPRCYSRCGFRGQASRFARGVLPNFAGHWADKYGWLP
ncbi:hypothetical protein, partial [Phycicoccus sp.]|uniref:hypothetical protein n=1 Tax=Phycicoccus sp. TaxID=1902410 RepID=UPI002CCAA009